MEQQTALDILKSGKSVFLTGAPGAGKTYVLNQYIDYLRSSGVEFAVTASTGIAASHIGGMTLHAFAGLGVQKVIDADAIKDIIMTRRPVVGRINGVCVLIIDEISMVSPDVFASVDAIMRQIRFSGEPFGGVQVILSGDFFQLPPVVRREDVQSASDIRYVWQGPVWRSLAPTICYIDENHRHEDHTFLQLLGDIRSMSVDEDSLEHLRACYKRDLSGHAYTRLYTHNQDVDRINQEALTHLTGDARRYPAVTSGPAGALEGIFSSSLVLKELVLKVGASVIFTKNDMQGSYVNGTIGTVVAYTEEYHLPVVETVAGARIVVQASEWTREDAKGIVTARVRQLPLRLAWAITVHKSQGMTLDAAEIDLSRSFEVGQGYVALSRVRSLSGLRLMGLNDTALRVDEAVHDYDQKLKQLSEKVEERYLGYDDVRLRVLHKTFVERCCGTYRDPSDPHSTASDDTANVIIKKAPIKKKKIATSLAQTYVLLQQGCTLEDIMQSRNLQRSTVLDHLHTLAKEKDLTKFDALRPTKKIITNVQKAVDAICKRQKKDDFLDDGQIRLRAISEHLDNAVTYDDIKRAMLFIAM